MHMYMYLSLHGGNGNLFHVGLFYKQLTMKKIVGK